MIIGDRLRALREVKKFSQGDIEKRTGLLRCYISRVENGHTVPAIETLEKMARALEDSGARVVSPRRRKAGTWEFPWRGPSSPAFRWLGRYARSQRERYNTEANRSAFRCHPERVSFPPVAPANDLRSTCPYYPSGTSDLYRNSRLKATLSQPPMSRQQPTYRAGSTCHNSSEAICSLDKGSSAEYAPRNSGRPLINLTARAKWHPAL